MTESRPGEARLQFQLDECCFVYSLAKISFGRFVEYQLWVQALELIKGLD